MASAIALFVLLSFGVLTIWVPGRWTAHLVEAGVFALAALWAARMMFRPCALRGSILLVPLGVAPLWGLAQLVLGATVYRYETWVAVLHWTTIFLVFLLSLQICGDHRARRTFRRALVYFGLAVSSIAVVQVFSSEGRVFWTFETPYKDNVLGPFVNRNNYAAFIELLLPMALVEALRRRRDAPLALLTAAVMYASVIASGSRAGSILVTVEVAVVFLLARYRGMAPGKAAGMAAGKLGMLVAVFTAVVGWGFLVQRFLQPDPYAWRREFLISSLAMIRERPWAGFGLGNWPTVYPAYAVFDAGVLVNHAHNDWIEWAAEGGIPFLLLLVWVAVRALRPAVASVWGLGLVAVFLHALVDYPFARLGLAIWPFAVLGMLVAAPAEEATQQSRDGGGSSPVPSPRIS